MKISTIPTSLSAIVALAGTANATWGRMCSDWDFTGSCTEFDAGVAECRSDQWNTVVSFSGTNAFWNDKVSSVTVWSPNVCYFYTNFYCQGSEFRVVGGTSWPELTGQFNDAFSSFYCLTPDL